ncbi:Serine/threonine-protein kinase H1-like protein [Fusarium oxysporum f. sp. raphani]|nr:Serine/threonine-protein kinase H1-like protein [Fusarium oxysporum f. sp. raphani]
MESQNNDVVKPLHHLDHKTYTMEVCQQAQTFIEQGDDCVFDHMKLILRSETGEYFYAKVKKRLPLSYTVDTHDLELVQIPAENIWPQFNSTFTGAPKPPPIDCYVKRASLLDYDPDTSQDHICRQVLEEAKVCEILRKNPHPNIAKYLGCVEVDGRIHGLCFAKYAMTLQERATTGTPLDTKPCVQGIKDGILHLHALGLTHNDINPRNIMMGADDNPVIIDFDSCKRVGEELFKGGTPDWMITNARYATPDNDFFGLSKLEEFLS